MESVWIAIAFALGLLMRPLGLPPLVGYLVAGFLLNALGVRGGPTLEHLAEVGVLLLLFSVGLKLRLKNFLRLDNFAGATIHLLVSCLVFAPLLRGLTGMDWNIALLVAAALSFSSTVIAAKALEERRELRAFHGRVAIGILVVQDLVAVALMGYAASTTPSIWSLSLLALPLLRPVLHWLLQVSGHDELLVLCGLLLALVVGGYGFDRLGLGPELGALVIGALLADHPKAKELSDTLWPLKEVFLVGFFLQIGMSGLPDLQTVGYALLLNILLPGKLILFFFIMLRLGLRVRSSFLASLSLASYSEFGLIVANLGAVKGWLSQEWLLLLAISMAISFAIAAPLNRQAHLLFERLEQHLKPLETSRPHPDDEPISLGQAHILIMGMGRVGTGAYDFLSERQERVVGLDSDPGKVERHLRERRRVLYADAEDPSFWNRLRMDEIRAVLLALPDVQANQFAARQLRRRGFRGLISAASRHPEDARAIAAAGASMTFNIFDEAGVGFAEHVWEELYNQAYIQKGVEQGAN
ncbi:MAG: cation:proton antiporter domain-containing protein [Chromatiales bacterium]